MSGLTKAERDFCEHVPYQLGRIADSLEKLANGKETKKEVQVEAPMMDANPKDIPFDVLAVTSVQVFPFKDGYSGMGHMKGLAAVVLNDQLQIRGIRIMDGENGLFVGYPNDRLPITRQLREHIENCVLEMYQQVMEG